MPVYIEKSGDLGKKNIINGAGNSDELRTQNCPPKGISRAGNSDIHLVQGLFLFALTLSASNLHLYTKRIIRREQQRGGKKISLRYESSTLILCKELSSSIFQSLSVSE